MSLKCHGGQLQVVSACRVPLQQMGTWLLVLLGPVPQVSPWGWGSTPSICRVPRVSSAPGAVPVPVGEAACHRELLVLCPPDEQL